MKETLSFQPLGLHGEPWAWLIRGEPLRLQSEHLRLQGEPLRLRGKPLLL